MPQIPPNSHFFIVLSWKYLQFDTNSTGLVYFTQTRNFDTLLRSPGRWQFSFAYFLWEISKTALCSSPMLCTKQHIANKHCSGNSAVSLSACMLRHPVPRYWMGEGRGESGGMMFFLKVFPNHESSRWWFAVRWSNSWCTYVAFFWWPVLNSWTTLFHAHAQIVVSSQYLCLPCSFSVLAIIISPVERPTDSRSYEGFEAHPDGRSESRAVRCHGQETPFREFDRRIFQIFRSVCSTSEVLHVSSIVSLFFLRTPDSDRNLLSRSQRNI